MTEQWQQIRPEAAREILDAGSATFLDVRDPASFAESHIPGAVQLGEADIEPFLADTEKSRTIVAYCYHGRMSQGAAAFLADQGFETVFSLIGGFEDWRQTHPIESGSSSV